MYLSLDDARWKDLEGGYRSPYDASTALRSFKDGVDVWDELWNELHHQVDVGLASYAAVPQLVSLAGEQASRDWNFYGIVATIEVASHRKDNPSLPEWLRQSYDEAWSLVSAIAVRDLESTRDSLTTQAIFSVLALAKGDLKLGALLSNLDGSELDELLDERLAWSARYMN